MSGHKRQEECQGNFVYGWADNTHTASLWSAFGVRRNPAQVDQYQAYEADAVIGLRVD